MGSMATTTGKHISLSSEECELRTDKLTRRLYATDASIYQIEPAGVAFPRTAGQAAAAIRAAVEAGLSVIPRGAGTGLVGGALGSGLVIDFARYNRQIRDFNREARTVRVGAGVVLDELNAFLRPHGLCFGPDVATSSRATLGGMIANDSSGARVPVYGTTIGHVLGLEIVLADGTIAEVGLGQDGLPRQRAAADAITDRYAKPIADFYRPATDRLLKRRPGYGFGRYRERRGDLTQLIGGSEGTLAGIFSATLKLSPVPGRRGLGVIFFASVADAMQATVELLDLKPAAIEHVDRILFDQTRGQLAFRAARSLLRLDEEPAEAFLIVEFFDDVDDRLAELERRRLGLRTLILPDSARQALVWGLRKAGLALLTGRPGPAKPVTGIEDATVLPEQLPDYVAGLRSILDPLKVEASFYGHAASGLLHVRPVLDLHTEEGVRNLRYIADEVSALVKQFEGSLAGEHGVGIARTEYLAEHLGPELVAAHKELKAAFDPRGVMNPGKIIAASSSSACSPARVQADGQGASTKGSMPFRIDTNLRQGADYRIELPFMPVLGFVDKDGSFVGNLEQCNGNGMCLKRAPAMCPTYIATGEEIMSTRGRANTIRAVLEGRIGADGDPLLSEDLEAALGPCLSCKACKTECPSNVDLAQLKAELLHERHRRAGVPLVDRMIASADLLGRIGCATAPVSNWMLRSRTVRSLMEKMFGIAAQRKLPAYASTRFDRWFARRCGTGVSPVRGGQDARPPGLQGGQDARPPSGAPRGRVVLWDDTWIRYHEPHIGMAAVKVLEAAGFEVVLARGRMCCGRPAFSRGLLDAAVKMGRHNVALLEREYAGLPVIFLEPSCLAMFLDEYRQFKIPGASQLAERCFSFEGFLDRLCEDGGGADILSICAHRGAGVSPALPSVESASREGGPLPGGEEKRFSSPQTQPARLRVAIHAHCHARALTDVGVLPRLARRLPGAEVQLLDTGCCGMAGAYGMMKSKYELSLAVARPLIDKIKALPEGACVVASGTSCRHQITDLAGVRPLHMAELLALHL